MSDYNQFIKRDQKTFNNYKRVHRHENYLQEYNYKLQTYKEKVNLNNVNTIFDNSHLYFRVFDNGLYLTNNSKLDFKKNIVKAFMQLNLPHSVDFEIEIELIESLFKLMKFEDSKANTYFGILDSYKFKNGLQNTPTIFDYPSNNFVVYKGNLWFKNYKNNKMDIDGASQIILISSDESKLLFKHFMLPLPQINTQKKLFKLMKRDPLIDLKILDNNGELIYYNIESTQYAIIYDNEGKCYKAKQLSKLTKQFQYKDTNIIQQIDANIVSDNIAQFLYKLTNGDINCLDKLASIVADIVTDNNESNKLNIIVGSQDLRKILKQFLYFISSEDLWEVDNIRKLVNGKMINSLIRGSEEIKTIIINDSSRVTSEEEIKLLKKIISGKAISFKNNFIGNLSFINSYSLIVISNDHSIISNYTNNFNTNIVNLSHIKEKPKLNFTMEELIWFWLPFALHGLNVIKGRNNNIERKKIRKKSDDYIILEFFNQFCSVSKKGEVYASDLHEAYEKYYKSCYGEKALSRVMFVKSIKRVLETTKYAENVKYDRPNHSRKQPNKYAFMGVSFDEKKLESYLENYIKREEDTEFDEFNQYLNDMNKLIPDIFLK